MSTTDDAIAVKRGVENELLAIPGVHSVGLGCKEVGGELTSGMAILVYVERKRARTELSPDERIPARIGGLDVDVIEQPPTRPQYKTNDIEREQSRSYQPLRGGVHIQLDEMRDAETGFGRDLPGHGGTLGFLARSTRVVDGGALVGVTNEHVAMVLVASGVRVAQPRFGLDVPSWDAYTIGSTLRALEPYDESGAQQQRVNGDAALIRIRAGLPVIAHIQDIGEVFGSRRVTDLATLPLPIRFRGAGGRVRHGVLTALDVTWDAFEVEQAGAEDVQAVPVRMTGQLRATGLRRGVLDRCGEALPDGWAGDRGGMRGWDQFSFPGESGSAWVDPCNRIIGCHFGSGGASGSATPIGVIEDELEISVLAWDLGQEYRWAPGGVQTSGGSLPSWMR
jgi:hypothetical protein